MEESLLLDTVERYSNGEMSAQELFHFEEMRKNNAEFDQMVVEHLFFIQDLEKYADFKRLKNRLNEVEDQLSEEGSISKSPLTGKSKLVYLWGKHKRTIAVAATIAIIVSVSCFLIVSVFSDNKQNNIRPLVEKLKEQDVKYKRLENQIGKLKSASELQAPIEKPRLESKFRATGFMIDVDNNYIITNAHVLDEVKNQLIVENNKGEQYLAESVYVNPENDLAIIKITDRDFKKIPSLPFSIKKTDADLGEQVFMLGYPKQEIVYGEGYVSAQNGYQMDPIFCQLSTLANEGNSGSPVINKNGELVGVVSSKEANSEGVVYAIKSSNIYSAINEMRKIKENESIRITSKPILRKTDRVTQIKKVQDYVFMIKGN
ncbi:MAG: serine protease [Bacteroidota bacterium]